MKEEVNEMVDEIDIANYMDTHGSACHWSDLLQGYTDMTDEELRRAWASQDKCLKHKA